MIIMFGNEDEKGDVVFMAQEVFGLVERPDYKPPLDKASATFLRDLYTLLKEGEVI